MTETGRTAAQKNFSFGKAQTALLRIVFQTGNHSVFPQNLKLFRFPAKPKIVPFSRKTHQVCHCEVGRILRPTRQSLTMRFVMP